MPAYANTLPPSSVEAGAVQNVGRLGFSASQRGVLALRGPRFGGSQSFLPS